MSRDVNMFPFTNVREQCRLQDTQNRYWVYWSPSKPTGGGCNSYTLSLDGTGPWSYKGQPVRLLSVNGIGEVRWEVKVRDGLECPDTGWGGEGAVKYFELVPLA